MNEGKVSATLTEIKQVGSDILKQLPQEIIDTSSKVLFVLWHSLVKVFVLSLAAGFVVTARPIIVDAPGAIARYLASFCAAGRPCEFGALYGSFGIALFLVVAVTLFLVTTIQYGFGINAIDEDENVTDLVYEDIVQAAKKDAHGITAERLAFTTGLDRIVVRDALLCLLADCKIVRRNSPTQYKAAPDVYFPTP